MLAALFSAGAEFKSAMGSPQLRILEMEIPADDSEPVRLLVKFEVNSGEGPVALSINQLTAVVAEKNNPFKFLLRCNVISNDDGRKIFLFSKGKSIESKLEAFHERSLSHQKWSELPHGDYSLLLQINSGKKQEFDYQWLGQSFSSALRFKVPSDGSKKSPEK
jgi:hypothetical protein